MNTKNDQSNSNKQKSFWLNHPYCPKLLVKS